MKLLASVLAVVAFSSSSFGAALGSGARTVIPAQAQQIISVDYRALRNSESGMALKSRVLPENLKQFEQALKGMGINPDRDLEQLTFISFRAAKGARTVGIATGSIEAQKFVARMKVKKIKPTKYRLNDLYSAGNGTVLSFIDPSTMVFGEARAVQDALDARDGETQVLDSSSQVSQMIADVESGPVWSVLDQEGTQNMMRSALGDASRLADYDLVKKRLLGSRYVVDFSRGVSFDLNVVTSDTMTAATMSSLIKAGVMYRKISGSAAEKSALENMSVDSNSGLLLIHFKVDDHKFESLLQTDLFASVSH